jgi:hypothetical protein
MFCPSCGFESTGLNYCNRCGANLTAPNAAPAVQFVPISLTKPILIIGILVAMITLGGFVGIIQGTIDMVRSGAGNVSPALPVLGLPCLLVIDILLIRQLSKLISAALSPKEILPPQLQQPTQTDPRFMPSTMTARLEGAPSVTENTTRFFEPAYREPQPVPRDKPDR